MAGVTRARIWRSRYQDSVTLMQVARELRGLPGVRNAAVLMGTPANHELLASAGLGGRVVRGAGPNDLIVAVEADSDAQAASALSAAGARLSARTRPAEPTARRRPQTLAAALRVMPDATLAAISVPGPYARREARLALLRGLHVFLFSDNVALDDEVALKRLARRRRVLCMGPDCGTAYVNGVGVGFANVVPRGRIGCVAASGTGLQAVASHVAALGEGVSQGLGVGGRDLSAAVGGAMTRLALEALAADPGTAVIVLVSKPAAAGVLSRLESCLRSLAKPVVGCCLGAAPAGASSYWVGTLEDAAAAAVAVVRGEPWRPRPFTDPRAVSARLEAALASRGRAGAGILGLYTGGTLAHEARLLLEPIVGSVASNLESGSVSGPHRILDLGADELTRGRPHPMLDPEARAARVREAGRDPTVGVLLLDLVLGRGVHPDPAAPLAAAVREARADARAGGRSLAAVASVVGTPGDPQGLTRQAAALEAAGVELLPSNAQAARFAALLARPDALHAVLEVTP